MDLTWSQNQLWNCTHFRHSTDEQLRHVDIYFLATNIICSLFTLNVLGHCILENNEVPSDVCFPYPGNTYP